MQRKNHELERINRNITRLNLISLLGILTSLKSKTQNDGGNTLLRLGGVLVALALVLNGVCDLISDLAAADAEMKEV